MKRETIHSLNIYFIEKPADSLEVYNDPTPIITYNVQHFHTSAIYSIQ